MDDKALKEARLRAERAVADMPSGDLKVKAFEVILTQLLDGGVATRVMPSVTRREPKQEFAIPSGTARSLSERILALQGEGFFDSPRAIASVREGLQAHGWHYPVTTLSGALQTLVQKRKLRRERLRDGKKVIWKYSNP